MKRIILFTIITVIFSFAGQIQNIYQSLKPWAPLNIQIDKGHLIITTKESRVTDTIFLSMIETGICMNYYFNKNLLNGIKNIYILNRFNHQGYVLDGAADICSAIGKMKSDNKIKWYILSKTHLY